MSSTTIDDQVSDKLQKYESIFKHYDIGAPVSYIDREDQSDTERNDHLIGENMLAWNENNRKKTINAKSTPKKSKKTTAKNSPVKHKHSKQPVKKTKHHNKVVKIPVPHAAKPHKVSQTSSQHKPNKLSKTASPSPAVALHTPSTSTMKTAQKLPSFQSQTDHSASKVQSSTNQLAPPTVVFHQPNTGKSVSLTDKSVDDRKSLCDLDEINKFTRDMFKFSNGNTSDGDHEESNVHRNRVRLDCKNQDNNLENYVKCRSHCLDIFDEYVATLKKQYGVIRDAASDPPNFDPGISITGPQVKKDPAIIDKEDSRTIKKLISIEPRKKYALVHEDIGIFIVGGYNLFVDIPVQKDPETDYLFKFDGSIVKVPRLHPCRANFAIYADSDEIYIAGGQTIDNELLDDVQRLNLKTLRWEPITKLTNPTAACGMTMDNDRIYLVGGYDIILSQTILLPDYMIYNLSTGKFEKSTDLPSARCRSLVFATDQAIFCVSGLAETLNDNNNKKLKISTDILKWSEAVPRWVEVSQTPELSKFHALSFNDPYLEITKRVVDSNGDEIDTIVETYYDFHKNIWAHGKAPTTENKPEVIPHPKKSPTKSKIPPSPKKHPSPMVKTPSKIKPSTKKSTRKKHK